MCKNIYLNTLLLLFISQSIAQINNDNYQILSSVYTDFNGNSHDVHLIETNFCVVQIEKSEITNEQLQDSETIIKILNRVDNLYNYYKTNLPKEPEGGNENYSYKANVFFGPPSCGSGCGLIGSKGIEVSGFENIYFNLKHNLNVNRDVIIAYEFGRNFSNNSIGKIALPFNSGSNEKNGGFYEGFAGFMTTNAFNEIMTNSSERHINETLMNIKWDLEKFRGYINDLDATPYNTIHVWEKLGVQDPNRGHDGWNDFDPSYTGGSFLRGTLETLEINIFDFIENLQSLNVPNTVEDALSNFSLAAARSINANLNYFFQNVMKFNLNQDAIDEMSLLPSLEDSLIRDQSTLWFLSPFEKIPLNIRSKNYLKDVNTTYRVLVGGEIYSESKDGNNELEYSILNNESSKSLKVEMVKNGEVIDSFSIEIKKRHNINIFDYSDSFYSYYLSNPFHSNFVENSTLTIDALEYDFEGHGLVFYNFNFSRDRDYELIGEVMHNSAIYTDQITGGLNSSGYSLFGFTGPVSSKGADLRVGYDIGSNLDSNFYEIKGTVNSNFMMPSDDRPYFMNRIEFSRLGFDIFSKFKNLIFKDITDTDSDGIIDFEDNCPDTPEGETVDENGCSDSQKDTDSDGITDDIDQCPDTPTGETADENGCSDSQKDTDSDGFTDDIDQCPDTPAGAVVDVNGCEVFILPIQNFKVEVGSATCVGNSDGVINLSIEDASYDYSVTMTGRDDLTIAGDSKTASITGLPKGTYTVCFKVDGEDNFEQCFEVEVNEPQALSAFMEVNGQNLNITMSGSSQYSIDVNGNTQITSSNNFETVLSSGLNIIKVYTSLKCQGFVEEQILISEEVYYYPNPTQNDVNILVGGKDENVSVSVLTIDGSLIYSREQHVSDISRKTVVDLSKQTSGTYIVVIESENVSQTFKIIKE